MDQELTPKEIVEKDFNLSMRGYNPTEVDEYLDIIIRDYDSFITEINDLRDQVAALQEELENQQTSAVYANSTSDQDPEASDLAEAADEDGHQSTQVTNFDILKRISNLERHVFGSKLNEEE